MMTTTSFPQFTQFPFELRHQIWLYTIPDDEPQVNLDPFFKFKRYEAWPRPQLPLCFPAIMHTCYEARTIVLEYFNKKKYWPALTRAQSHGINVPRRAFIPELDVLYMEPGYHGDISVRRAESPVNPPGMGWSDLVLAPEIRRLRSIAFPWGTVPYQALAVFAMYSLEISYIVFCDDWPLPPVPDVPGPPWDRPFKLVEMTEEEEQNGVPLETIHPQRRTVVPVKDNGLVDIHGYAREEEKRLMQALKDHQDEERVRDWWDNRPEKGMPLKVVVKRLVRAPAWYKAESQT
ncbi:hypothetical protein QBC38DRAFT_493239 [Podospora fimiseda]|uniref:2EXR domain-containing protein n=1 Tax=Podospora fimiseda TaxID=252190 RepID=A0AAN7BGE1_9PEZI|nr:hypothetical protein QBC38DRAFT_493239 [Podospora fimiseda]